MTTTASPIHTPNHKEAVMVTLSTPTSLPLINCSATCGCRPAPAPAVQASECTFADCRTLGEHLDHAYVAADAERGRVEFMRAGRIEAARTLRIEGRAHHRAAVAAGQIA